MSCQTGLSDAYPPFGKGGWEGFPVRPFYNAEVMGGQQFRLGVQTPDFRLEAPDARPFSLFRLMSEPPLPFNIP